MKLKTDDNQLNIRSDSPDPRGKILSKAVSHSNKQVPKPVYSFIGRNP